MIIDLLLRCLIGGVIVCAFSAVSEVIKPQSYAGIFGAAPLRCPRHQAGIDALGAAVGAVGLLAFALLIWLLAPRVPAWLVIALAAVLWLVASTLLWIVSKRVQGDQMGVSP